MGISYQDSTGIGDVLALQLWQTIGAQNPLRLPRMGNQILVAKNALAPGPPS